MTFAFDFNDAPEQGGELIPAKTMAKVTMKIRPGGCGESGWLSKSDSGFEYLNAECTVMSSPYSGRKIFQNMGVGGPTEGHQTAAKITRALLRAALESARNINPKDESDQARHMRQVSGWGDFNEIEFAVEVGIDKDKTGQYGDKNKILKVVTPDHSKYQQVMNGETIVPEGVKSQGSQNQGQTQAAPAWQQSAQEKAQQPQEDPSPQHQPSQQSNTIPPWAQ